MKVPTYLDDVCGRLQSEFESNRRVMSFDEYLALQMENPGSQVRDASQYLRDCFDYFGSEDKDGVLGSHRRWNLFDVPWDDGRHRLIGQEGVQQAIYRSLLNFTPIRELRLRSAGLVCAFCFATRKKGSSGKFDLTAWTSSAVLDRRLRCATEPSAAAETIRAVRIGKTAAPPDRR